MFMLMRYIIVLWRVFIIIRVLFIVGVDVVLVIGIFDEE